MSVEVVYTFPDTTSPVKLVQFINRGITVRAVLKLYDRTHPGRIRKSTAPSLLDEGKFRSWGRDGRMHDFIPTLEQA
jgi:hypothetical protein